MSETHAQTVTFVRDTMLPPVPPPMGERGAVKWMRANLFSTPLNIALTLLGLLIIYWLVASSLPWWRSRVPGSRGSEPDVRDRPGKHAFA